MKASTPLIDGLVETALDAGAAAERHPVLSLMLIRSTGSWLGWAVLFVPGAILVRVVVKVKGKKVMDAYPPTVQRPALLKFAEALKCRDNALRRDECGDWRINGKQGHIYAVPGTINQPGTPGFQIYVQRESIRGWSAAKTALKSFTDLTLDCEVDGMLFLDRLPTATEAEVIRQYVGISKKREVSEGDGSNFVNGHRAIKGFVVKNWFRSPRRETPK